MGRLGVPSLITQVVASQLFGSGLFGFGDDPLSTRQKSGQRRRHRGHATQAQVRARGRFLGVLNGEGCRKLLRTLFNDRLAPPQEGGGPAQVADVLNAHGMLGGRGGRGFSTGTTVWGPLHWGQCRTKKGR